MDLHDSASLLKEENYIAKAVSQCLLGLTVLIVNTTYGITMYISYYQLHVRTYKYSSLEHIPRTQWRHWHIAVVVHAQRSSSVVYNVRHAQVSYNAV